MSTSQVAGISATLLARHARENSVLDLAAVLEGLVGSNFEIIIVGGANALGDLQFRVPRLPLRAVPGTSLADGCKVASYDVLLLSVPDGRFDVRQLNRLFEAMESGADIAAGYRPHRTDGLVRKLARLYGRISLDWAYGLVRRVVWLSVPCASLGELVQHARHRHFRVAELRVSDRRPWLGLVKSAPLTVR